METIAGRLKGKLTERRWSIRRFQQAVLEEGPEVRGTSYASVHDYVEKGATPSLSFLHAAARVLGVRVAWLAFDEGPSTDAEAQVRAIGDASSPYQAIHEEGMITALATQGVGNRLFFYIVERLVAAAPDEDPTPSPDDLRLLSRGLQSWIQVPWITMRRGRPTSLDASADYHLAMMTALLRAVPGRGEGRTIRDVIEDLGGLHADVAESGKET